jgi:hypothetical protein
MEHSKGLIDPKWQCAAVPLACTMRSGIRSWLKWFVLSQHAIL